MTSEIFWQRHPDINHTSSVRRQARHTMLRALWELHRKSSSCNTCLLRKGDGHIFRLKRLTVGSDYSSKKPLRFPFHPVSWTLFFINFMIQNDTKGMQRSLSLHNSIGRACQRSSILGGLIASVSLPLRASLAQCWNAPIEGFQAGTIAGANITT